MHACLRQKNDESRLDWLVRVYGLLLSHESLTWELAGQISSFLMNEFPSLLHEIRSLRVALAGSNTKIQLLDIEIGQLENEIRRLREESILHNEYE